jgi:drug/metabolite transporter (DMT)-like permease
VLSIVLTLFAAVTNAASSVLQRRAHHEQVRRNVHGLRGMLAALRHPVWLGGVALLPISAVLGAAALGTGQVAVVQSVQCLELPMVLVLSSVVFKHRLRARDWTSIGVMAGGMAVWLFAMHPSPGNPAAVHRVAWIAGAGTAGVLVALLAVAGWHGGRGGRTRRAQLLGVAAGASFALAAVFISADLAQGLSWSILVRWQTYAVVLSSAAAMLFMQYGMQAGTLVAVQPGVTLADPVVAISLGVLLFHEHIRTGLWLIPEVIAAVAITYETIALSRSPLIGERLEHSPGEPTEAHPERQSGFAGPRAVQPARDR